MIILGGSERVAIADLTREGLTLAEMARGREKIIVVLLFYGEAALECRYFAHGFAGIGPVPGVTRWELHTPESASRAMLEAARDIAARAILERGAGAVLTAP